MAKRANRQHEYRFKAGSKLPVKRAQKIGEHLGKIGSRMGGALTAEVVLEDAAKKGSFLHDLFEWNDSAAAHRYRMDQARHLIRSVEVVYCDVPEQRGPIRAFVTIEKCEGVAPSEYLKLCDILSNPEHKAALLAQAKREAKQWAAKYRQFTELAAIIAVIDKAAA